MEPVKLARTVGSTMPMLNAATGKTHATSVKPWSTEFVNVLQATEETQTVSVNHTSNVPSTVTSTLTLVVVLVILDTWFKEANAFHKSPARKTVLSAMDVATVMMVWS